MIAFEALAKKEESVAVVGLGYVGLPLESLEGVDAVVMAVAHGAYRNIGLKGLADLCGGGQTILVDVKGQVDPADARQLGFVYWRL